jgi:hypothetical protein
VDRLGGHLHVHSQPGAGTTVHAIVPLDPHRHTGDATCRVAPKAVPLRRLSGSLK